MRPRRPTCSLLACVLALAASLPAGAAPAAAPPAAAPAAVAAILASPRLRQGDPLVAWVAAEAAAPALEARLLDAAGMTVARARCFPAGSLAGEADQSLPPSNQPEQSLQPSERSDRRLLGLVMALPLGLKPGAYRLLVGGASTPIAVESRSFPLETLRLGEANTRLRTEPTARKTEQARRLYDLLYRVDDAAVFAEPATFLFPVEGGVRSAGFGDTRRYLYADGGSESSVHAGIDWAVREGTPVRACARGRVVMAMDRDVTGKTLVIEHLPGLYSLYFHLSAIEVAEGAIVERGARIALSGSTGLATGPHLHWELRAGGNPVDPEFWLGSPLLDKNRIRAIMYGLIEGR
jgi:murein DD-endopeptidase MepM/ murein hydrolase activator NlpD